MTHLSKLGACSAAVASILTISSPGQAQQPGANRALEEIVVTARRREENLQQVPVAITAVGAEALEQRNIENVRDLNVLLPNVDLRGGGVDGPAGGSAAIRGIPGVARYIDGVHVSGSEGSLVNVVELERIEVLRGPQGTLFGKNAIGGAIQYVTQKPQDEFGARIKATFGESNRNDVVANIDIPLGDTVKTKVTAANLTRDGFVDSVIIDESYGEIDNQIVRGMLQWEPTDNFTAMFIADYNKVDQNMQANVLWNVFDSNDPIFDTENPPRLLNTIPAYNTYDGDGDGEPDFPFTDELYAYGQREQYLSASDHTGTGWEMEENAFMADLAWDITDTITFRSITGLRDLEWGNYEDVDGTLYVQFDRWQYREIEETSQEFQLLGGNDRINYVIGLYYFEEDEKEFFSSWQRWEMPPGGIGLPGTAPRPRNELEYIVRTDTAIFAEVTFDLNDTLSLTVGGRETEEEFEFATMVPENPLGPPHSTPTNVNGTVRLTDGVPTQGTRDFNKFTPRISLQNQFTDTIMGYISYSEGFNGGGVNSRFDPLLPDNGITPFEGEVLKNIELGLRSDLADGRLRLNATAFTGTWEDIQIGEVLTPGTTTTTNAGEAEIEGLEIEGIWRATDNLAINFTYGSLDTRYTDVGSAVVISTNSRFAFAPETSYSIGFRHDASLEGGGTLTTSLEYGWIDDFETFRNDEFQVSAHNGDYGLLSGRVMWTPAQGNWDFSVFGTNLTDEYYRMGGFPAILAGVDQGVVARPRELGVTLRLRL